MTPSFTRAQAEALGDREANDRYDRLPADHEDVVVSIVSYDSGQLHIARDAGGYGVIGYTDESTVSAWDSADTTAAPCAVATVSDTSDIAQLFVAIQPLIASLIASPGATVR